MNLTVIKRARLCRCEVPWTNQDKVSLATLARPWHSLACSPDPGDGRFGSATWLAGLPHAEPTPNHSLLIHQAMPI